MVRNICNVILIWGFHNHLTRNNINSNELSELRKYLSRVVLDSWTIHSAWTVESP